MQIEPFELERIQSIWEHVVEYNLSESGVHPMSVSELVGDDSEALHRLIHRELGYSQTNGTVELRERIAHHYPGATPADILVSNGTSEANFVTIWSLLEAGDELVLMLPNYMQLWGLARGFRGTVKPFHLRAENKWSPDLDELRRAVSNKTKAIAVCNPNNPTGAILSEAEMREIVEIAAQSGVWLIADEVYLGAEREAPRTKSFWSFREKYDRIIINNGLSKAYGLPGLRIGWIVSSPDMAAKLWSYRDYTTIAPGNLSDQLAQLALVPDTREKIFSRTREILRGNFVYLKEWMNQRGELFDLVEPQAGAIALPRYKLSLRSIELVEKLRIDQSVLVVPGAYFGLDGFIRIGYGAEIEYLKQGLDRIDKTLKSLL